MAIVATSNALGSSQTEGGKSGMKLILRIMMALTSLLIAYLTTRYVAGFTGAPLGNGKYEGTPVTSIVALIVFPLTAVALLVTGNILINRHFQSRDSK
jgi:hypothetical protein